MSKISVLLPEVKIENRITKLAEEITKDFAGEKITVICTLKGAVVFTVKLTMKISLDMEFYYLDVSSYNNQTVSSGTVRIKNNLDIFDSEDFQNRNILLIEDIIDSGRTVNVLVQKIAALKPKKFKVVTLLDKPDRRDENCTDLKPDYVGFVIPNKFVIGYGLDYAQLYRNLPYVGVLDEI